MQGTYDLPPWAITLSLSDKIVNKFDMKTTLFSAMSNEYSPHENINP